MFGVIIPGNWLPRDGRTESTRLWVEAITVRPASYSVSELTSVERLLARVHNTITASGWS